MRERQYAALVARAERLADAVLQASDRLKDEYTPLIIEIGDPTLQFIKYGTGHGIVSGFRLSNYPAWRVGRNPGDKFFELKLVPEARTLALPVPRVKGQVKAETFVLVPFDRLLQVYKPAEIRTIASLVDKIKPFKAQEKDTGVRIFDYAMHSEDPNLVTYPDVIPDEAPAY